MKMELRGHICGGKLYLNRPRELKDRFPAYFILEIDSAQIKPRNKHEGIQRGRWKK